MQTTAVMHGNLALIFQKYLTDVVVSAQDCSIIYTFSRCLQVSAYTYVLMDICKLQFEQANVLHHS